MHTHDEIYITDIEAYHWQSHHHNKVTLVNGINAFVGTSNSGKTALLRLIEWVLKNKPGGSDFITNGFDDCYGVIGLSNGYRIKRSRTRSGSVNTYELWKDGEPVFENPLTGFGTSVPPEIADAIGMGDMLYNISKQLEAPFLISETPGSRAKTIGNMEELSQIDEALTGTNGDVALYTKLHKSLETEIKKKEKEADALRKEIAKEAPKVEKMKQLKERIATQEQTLNVLQKSVQRLQEIDSELDAIYITIDRAARVLSAWDEGLPARVDMFQRLSQNVGRLAAIEQELSAISYMNGDTLERLLAIASQVEGKIQVHERLNRSVRRLFGIAVEVEDIDRSYSERIAAIDYTPIEQQINSYRALIGQVDRLRTIQTEVELADQHVQESQVQLELLINQFVDAIQQAKVCPTCLQSTDQVSCEHIKQVI